MEVELTTEVMKTDENQTDMPMQIRITNVLSRKTDVEQTPGLDAAQKEAGKDAQPTSQLVMSDVQEEIREVEGVRTGSF